MDAQEQNFDFGPLVPDWFRQRIADWIKDDMPTFDYSGFVAGTSQKQAILFGKSEGVLAGVPFVNLVFDLLGCTIEWHLREGSYFNPPSKKRSDYAKIATVTGPANKILQGERTALNILSQCSAIALNCRRVADKIKEIGWKGRVAATRKTTPGFHLVQKYGVLVGGCDTHRMDLSDMVMLKDNAIDAAGSIRQAVANARRVSGFSHKIEVESRNEAEAEEAALSGADIVMLDNFSPDEAHRVGGVLKARFPHLLIEVSGGITSDNLHTFASPHIDILSSSRLILGCDPVDMSLKIVTA